MSFRCAGRAFVLVLRCPGRGVGAIVEEEVAVFAGVVFVAEVCVALGIEGAVGDLEGQDEVPHCLVVPGDDGVHSDELGVAL